MEDDEALRDLKELMSKKDKIEGDIKDLLDVLESVSVSCRNSLAIDLRNVVVVVFLWLNFIIPLQCMTVFCSSGFGYGQELINRMSGNMLNLIHLV